MGHFIFVNDKKYFENISEKIPFANMVCYFKTGSAEHLHKGSWQDCGMNRKYNILVVQIMILFCTSSSTNIICFLQTHTKVL